MKANEVPDKICISVIPSKFGGNKTITCGKDFPNAVEYTRTDAFIEKACEWIMNHFSSEGFGSPLYYKGFLYRPEDIVEDFKKYMKQ